MILHNNNQGVFLELLVTANNKILLIVSKEKKEGIIKSVIPFI